MLPSADESVTAEPIVVTEICVTPATLPVGTVRVAVPSLLVISPPVESIVPLPESEAPGAAAVVPSPPIGFVVDDVSVVASVPSPVAGGVPDVPSVPAVVPPEESVVEGSVATGSPEPTGGAGAGGAAGVGAGAGAGGADDAGALGGEVAAGVSVVGSCTGNPVSSVTTGALSTAGAFRPVLAGRPQLSVTIGTRADRTAGGATAPAFTSPSDRASGWADVGPGAADALGLGRCRLGTVIAGMPTYGIVSSGSWTAGDDSTAAGCSQGAINGAV